MIRISILLLFLITTTRVLKAQDLTCQEKYANGICAARYKVNSQGKIHGQFVQYDNNGKIIKSGKYNNGEKDGSWFDSSDGAFLFFGGPYQWFENGILITGSLKEINSLEEANKLKKEKDETTKRTETISIGGVKYKAEYRLNSWGNCYDGSYKVFYLSNKPYKVLTFQNCNEEGEYYMYFESGKLMESGKYLYGKKSGQVTAYYETGAVYFKANFSVGKEDGLWEQYYPNGKIKLKYNYREGELHGICEDYHENGNVSHRMTYHYGQEQGGQETFSESGVLEMKETVELLTGGLKSVSHQQYSSSGKIISKGTTVINPYQSTEYRDKIWEWFDNAGKPVAQIVYRNGKKEGVFFIDLDNKKYSGAYNKGKLTGSDTIYETGYVVDFFEFNKIEGISETMADTILLSVNYSNGLPSGNQFVYQKGTRKLLAKILYDKNGTLQKIERYFLTLADEENKIQYQNCMISLTKKCTLKPSATPYSTGYTHNGEIMFNYFNQGTYSEKVDYPNAESFAKTLKSIIVKNQKGELEIFFNELSIRIGDKKVVKAIISDFIPLFENEGYKHKDFKTLKEIYLN